MIIKLKAFMGQLLWFVATYLASSPFENTHLNLAFPLFYDLVDGLTLITFSV